MHTHREREKKKGGKERERWRSSREERAVLE